MSTLERKDNGKKNNKALAIVGVIIALEVLFIAVYFLTTLIYKNVTKDKPETESGVETTVSDAAEATTVFLAETTTNNMVTTTLADAETTTAAETTTKKESSGGIPNAVTIAFPSDDASWKLICLDRSRCVDSTSESKISLSYVAGSSEQMDSRAAAAYERMYDAAAAEGIYLTPCSGYRSYSTQKRLYYEFVNEYLADGYSEEEAHNLTSKRRNPPGSSEHNIGICMDIICASSSANFQNTKAYAWLDANAQDYGFILRYPEDKVNITGVKFEPWHWRYVGVENAAAIKNSGLCLEEYLGLV